MIKESNNADADMNNQRENSVRLNKQHLASGLRKAGLGWNKYSR